MKTPEILAPALRQYQHNDCSGLVVGFDYDETVKILDRYREALIWCSGSADFGPGGQAEKGWEKICKPLL